ncbi:MAG: BNR repeat-containing protein [Saprospiraceae bacterium]|nr:BNR repeat-containing protein [Saprospiraceae bacterium]
MRWSRFYLLLSLLFSFPLLTYAQVPKGEAKNINGYRGIWFSLGQFSEFGDKYSGGLGTYTAKHRPLAIYDALTHTSYFVYGGTTHRKAKHLLCMIGSFDHTTGKCSKPRVVYDKMGVDDPHDNPSLAMDDAGYIWVFVSGRGRKRPGFKFRSHKARSIDQFIEVSEEEMTYPQPWWLKGKGFFHFFTKYTGVRELYFETSKDGLTWAEDQKLAGIVGLGEEKSGHYQVSYHFEEKVATFFSRHPNGNVDKRTNLYYVESTDMGQTWQTIDQKPLDLPIQEVGSSALVQDYAALGKNVYLKDMQFDELGNPICLYLTSGGHQPGPANAPREWQVCFWRAGQWHTRVITTSDHNYDMGSLWVEDDRWRVIAPTQTGPQPFGGGGEVVEWWSEDAGETWALSQTITAGSTHNHNYIRRVHGGVPPFLYFWADGNPDSFSRSKLYFGDQEGQVWQLPYRMRRPWAKPRRVK